MTLCVAWKYEEAGVAKICFAADTCVVLGGRAMAYGGIKVLEIPVEYGTPPAEGGHAQPAWSSTYGFAFAGSFLPAFLLKELVADVLTHVQGIGGPQQAAFDKLCGLVAKLHRHFHDEIHESLEYEGELDFFFGGFCPATQRVRVAKFFVDAAEVPQWREILQGGGVRYEMIGMEDACGRFRELFELNLSAPPCRVHYAVWHRLRDVILDPAIEWVDGAIQYGEFDRQGQFHLYGSSMIEMGPDHPILKTFVRGTHLDNLHQPTGFNDLYVSYPFLVPFAEEIQAFEARAFYSPDGKRLALDELITVLPHDPNWADAFASEAEFLKLSFPQARGIEHIGTTAVSGMLAVPVIDIIVGIPALWPEHNPPVNLQHRGFDYIGCDGIGTRRLYRKRGSPSFNLHIAEYDGHYWKTALAFREYLRARPDARDAFGKEKLRILNAGPWMLAHYTRRKHPFLRSLADAAGTALADPG